MLHCTIYECMIEIERLYIVFLYGPFHMGIPPGPRERHINRGLRVGYIRWGCDSSGIYDRRLPSAYIRSSPVAGSLDRPM